MKAQRVLTAVAALVLLAGCGGGRTAKATPTPSADIHRMMLDIAQCARAHGAPNFPDPVVDVKGDWDFPQAQLERQPKVPACDALVIRMKRASPRRARPTVSPQDLVKLREYAACMRAQGVTDWPDPGPDGAFRLPTRLQKPQRSEKQDRVCFSKAPKGGVQIVGGPPKGR